MKITAVNYERGRLTLETPDIQQAMRFAYSFKEGEYSITKAKPRRSLDANAYAWVLMDKLANATGLPKEEVYRNAIRGIGGVSEIVCVPEKSVDTLSRVWQANGLGWQIETMPSKLPGCVMAIMYYGSSAYDTQQMSRLIDQLTEDCRALDIETRPADEVKSLLDSWEA